MIGRNGKRGSGISMQVARHDDNDNDDANERFTDPYILHNRAYGYVTIRFAIIFFV